ncbi:hypothetical protein [Floccifex sp.]|uniref:hypothetical protein n=1 Tax=Floccifex sp. TaxID=2815810 RepID=UPI003F0568B9
MRINEYNCLDEFVDEYNKGVEMPWQNSDGKRRYMGIEFTYKGVYYRMCREPGEDDEMPKLSNGKIGRYDVMICHWAMPDYKDDNFILIGWYSDLNDVLENCIIDGRKFKDVIMDDFTKIEGKD